MEMDMISPDDALHPAVRSLAWEGWVFFFEVIGRNLNKKQLIRIAYVRG